MKPEESARKRIDDLLELAGWKLQDYENLNLGAGVGIAVREYPLKKFPLSYLQCSRYYPKKAQKYLGPLNCAAIEVFSLGNEKEQLTSLEIQESTE